MHWIRSLETVIHYHSLGIKPFHWKLLFSVFTAESLNVTHLAAEEFCVAFSKGMYLDNHPASTEQTSRIV